jgi:GGDEF domain-containing protein
MLDRYNGTMFLALLSVGNLSGQKCDDLVLETVMKRLLGIAQTDLRCGDTISRYSVAQYVILLPAVTYETGRLVMDRIKTAFYEKYPKSSVVLTYKHRPLGSNQYDAFRFGLRVRLSARSSGPNRPGGSKIKKTAARQRPPFQPVKKVPVR